MRRVSSLRTLLYRGGGEFVAHKHLHAKSQCDFHHIFSYRPRTDDADSPAEEVETFECFGFEVAFLSHLIGGFRQAARDCQEKREGEFGDGTGAVGGDVAYDDAALFDRSHVYIVYTRRARGDAFESG